MKAVGQPSDAFLDAGLPEIDEEAEPQPGQADVGKGLFRVHRRLVFNGFQLNNDEVVDEEVRSDAHVEAQVVLADGNRHLALDAQAAPAQLMCSLVQVGLARPLQGFRSR